ncbi:oxygen-dependent tRNA uridine(34) hydroxylase TrhO [Lactococcus termiticola]|uniref:tRNA uridine(34) hydroxylase n=1 Tax=Lactococcus termiticola TaxID=2169526 RepID=A0A2R5HES5_9LACT|nr:rhodanese-related sulfurtransferase [Lactococcus termiticola]GBG96577.1 hypothetical protein NtB2_00690 [Lactococcus termiticola]
MQKIILFYKFTPISDPKAIQLWQKLLCDSLNLKGRILINEQGINGTLGGELEDVKAYIKATRGYEGFRKTVFKWSDGSRDDFPKMQVRVRKELVGFRNTTDEFQVDETGVIGGGVHLSPEKVNEMVEQYGDDVVFFDGRNEPEAAVGKFKGAIVPNTETSRDFERELESGKYDHMKGKKIITYCTGGVRCELISVMMKNRGFDDVYQIDGGIVKYGEKYGDSGLWEGALRVFDKRKVMTFTDEAKTIGKCMHCGKPTSNFENCQDVSCNQLMLVCEDCFKDEHKQYHTEACYLHDHVKA